MTGFAIFTGNFIASAGGKSDKTLSLLQCVTDILRDRESGGRSRAAGVTRIQNQQLLSGQTFL